MEERGSIASRQAERVVHSLVDAPTGTHWALSVALATRSTKCGVVCVCVLCIYMMS